MRIGSSEGWHRFRFLFAYAILSNHSPYCQAYDLGDGRSVSGFRVARPTIFIASREAGQIPDCRPLGK